MPLSHVVNGNFPLKKTLQMSLIGLFKKGETPRKKWVQNVHAKEVQTQKGKDIQKSTKVPKKFKVKKCLS